MPKIQEGFAMRFFTALLTECICKCICHGLQSDSSRQRYNCTAGQVSRSSECFCHEHLRLPTAWLAQLALQQKTTQHVHPGFSALQCQGIQNGSAMSFTTALQAECICKCVCQGLQSHSSSSGQTPLQAKRQGLHNASAMSVCASQVLG